MLISNLGKERIKINFQCWEDVLAQSGTIFPIGTISRFFENGLSRGSILTLLEIVLEIVPELGFSQFPKLSIFFY